VLVPNQHVAIEAAAQAIKATAIKRERRTSGCHKTAMVTLIGRPRLDDAEATCMHRLISIKNVAVLPKVPSTAVNHRAAGEIRLLLASTCRSGKI
jgi:hypothetical protein